MYPEILSFEDLINAIGYYICIYDKNGVIAHYNSAFKNSYLQGADNFAGKHYSSIENEEFQSITGLPAFLKTGKSASVQKRFGIQGLFYVNTAPVANADNDIIYIAETIATPFNAPVLPIKEGLPDAPAGDIFLSDVKMQNILETINRISNFDSTVLITGESGTGKSMLAKFIHAKSKRSSRPFVTINCATIPENLIESELFGYTSGAFTGASQKGKKGLVEQADTGTLFLDEIGLLPLSLQAKFLQLIQEKTYTPIGAVKQKTVDVRIISATNLNLKKQINERKFREDLYYRLRVIEFYMPPLRERPDAIDSLVDYFLNLYNKKYQIKKSISPKAREMLHNSNWSGNIRELQYVIERLVVTSRDNQITSADVPRLGETSPSDNQEEERVDFDCAVKDFEKELLLKYFAKYRSSYKVAAALGLSQTKAFRLLRKYNIH